MCLWERTKSLALGWKHSPSLGITHCQLSTEISHNVGLHIHPGSQWHLQDLEARSPAIPEALIAATHTHLGSWKPLRRGLLSLLRITVPTCQAGGPRHQHGTRPGEGLHACWLGMNSSSLSHTLFKRASKQKWGANEPQCSLELNSRKEEGSHQPRCYFPRVGFIDYLGQRGVTAGQMIHTS